MKIKLQTVKLTKKQKHLLKQSLSTPLVKQPLFSDKLINTIDAFRTRFTREAKECDSISKRLFSAPFETILFDVVKIIDERVEVLFAIFTVFEDAEFLPWDELMHGSYMLNISYVLQAKAVLVEIIHLVSQKYLKIPALLSLCFKLGTFVESFESIKMLNPTIAKLEHIANVKLGGKATAKLRTKDMQKLSVLIKQTDAPNKKRKMFYKELTTKWNSKYPEKEVSVRTMQTYVKKIESLGLG